MFNQVVANISGQVRKATLNGRKYLVAPVRMIVPGVLNGSKGPLYYSLDEIQKDYHTWNHIPIVLGHPKIDGKPVSARSPAILEQYQLCFIFNTTASDNLDGEGWFDIELTKKVEPRILLAIQAGKPIELSTGLFTDDQPAPTGATYNGKSYSSVARNFKPDHLAVLLDEKGACSLQDGCGVLVNSEKRKEMLAKLIDILGLSDEEEEDSSEDEGGDTEEFEVGEIEDDAEEDDDAEGVSQDWWQLIPADNSSNWFELLVDNNCGIGPGGFQPGNRCAAGGSGGGGGGSGGGGGAVSNPKNIPKTGTVFKAKVKTTDGSEKYAEFVEVTGSGRLNKKVPRYTAKGGNKLEMARHNNAYSLSKGERVFRKVEPTKPSKPNVPDIVGFLAPGANRPKASPGKGLPKPASREWIRSQGWQ